jgi:hypothetical protein
MTRFLFALGVTAIVVISACHNAPEPPDSAAAVAAQQLATRLITEVRTGLADDQLEQAHAALVQLQPLAATLPAPVQEEIARLEAMFADQPFANLKR